VLIELHGIGNVIGLRCNEAVGLIVERRKCLRGARRQIRPMREVLRKGHGRRSNTHKEYGKNDPESHWLSRL
jgi:hypothetical protein